MAETNNANLACLADYELLEEIGEDGPARIFRARQKSLERMVALHLVRLDDLGDVAAGERYLRGARAAARLDHPAIARVYDVGSGEGWAYVATGLVEGATLAERHAGKPLAARPAAELVHRLATAIAAAHKQGIVHGGVDPTSIRFDASGQPRIVGFGAARQFVSGATLASMTAAVSAYSPPEHIAGNVVVTPPVDVYALGGLLYFALVGQPPFGGQNAAQLALMIAETTPVAPAKRATRVPKELDAICMRCLAKNRDERFADAGELADALRRWLHIEPVQIAIADPMAETLAPGPGSTRRMAAMVAQVTQRRWRPMVATGLLLLLASTALLLILLRNNDDGPSRTAAADASDLHTPSTAPPPAVAPFDASAASSHQKAWAEWLGVGIETTNPLGMKLRLIPPGEFDMGATDAERAARRQTLNSYQQLPPDFNRFCNDVLESESPRRRIRITRPFWLGTYEVTTAEFEQFCQEMNYRTLPERERLFVEGVDRQGAFYSSPWFTWRWMSVPVDPRWPVGAISFRDMDAFCEWLTAREGVVYRLPTEAEWEHACRAGTTEIAYFSPDQRREHANVADQSLQGRVSDSDKVWAPWNDGHPLAAPVGSFKPNPFGLHDMIGNQWEACSDWFRNDAYQSTDANDPTGPISGFLRVARGGGWDPGVIPEAYSSTCRIPSPEGNVGRSFGFRVVREVDPPDGVAPNAAWADLLIRDARRSADEASTIPLIGSLNLLRAIHAWKAAEIRLRRAEKYSAFAANSAGLDELARTISFGQRLAGGLRDVERRLIASLSAPDGDLDYQGAANGLAELLRELGWDLKTLASNDARNRLDKLPASLRESLLHWCARWEIYASKTENPDAALLPAAFVLLDDAPNWQRYLAAKKAADAAPLVRLFQEMSDVNSAPLATLIVEVLATRGWLNQPAVWTAFDRAQGQLDRDGRGERNWIALRMAQAAELRSVGEANYWNELLAAWDAAARLWPADEAVANRFAAVVERSPSAADREVAERVLMAGGAVQIWHPRPKGETWARFPIRSLADLPRGLFHVTVVSLVDCPIDDAALLNLALSRLPHLERVHLDGAAISDVGLRTWLEKSRRLELLSVERTGISRAGIPAHVELGELHVRRSKLSAADVDELCKARPSLVVRSDGDRATGGDTTLQDLTQGQALACDSGQFVSGEIDFSESPTITLEAWCLPRSALGFEFPLLVHTHGPPPTPDAPQVTWTMLGLSQQRNASFEMGSPQKYASAAAKIPNRATYFDRPMHLAAVADGKEYRVYLDGKLLQKTPSPLNSFARQRNYDIGGSTHRATREFRQFHGLIDEVRISTVARYSADFTPAVRHEPDEHTALLLHFDETDVEFARDSSGRNRHGRFVGGARVVPWSTATNQERRVE